MRSMGLTTATVLCGSAMLALAGCSPAPVDAKEERVTREPGARGNEFVTLATAAGEELTISCEEGRADSLQWVVGQPPSSPPPLAGVYFTVALDDGPAEQVEAGWFQKDRWSTRGSSKDLATRIAKSKRVRLTPAPAYTPGKVIEWRAPAELAGAWCRPKTLPTRPAG